MWGRAVGFFATITLLLSAVATAGVGAWTLAPSSSGFGGVVVGPGGAVYADCPAGICKSLNQGRTWQSISGPPGGGFLSFVDSSGAIYAVAYGGGGGAVNGTFYVTRDEGATWAEFLFTLGYNSLSLSADPFSADTFLVLGGFVCQAPILYAGNLLLSTDDGMHWVNQAIDDRFFTQSVTAFALDPHASGRLYVAAVGAGPPCLFGAPSLFTSIDLGSTWTLSAPSLPGAFVTMLVDPFHATTIVGGGPAGIFRSTDGGQTFSAQSTAAVVQFVADPVRSGRLYTVTSRSGVLTSPDGGVTWTPLNAGLTNLAVSAIALDAAGGYLYAATNSGLFVLELPLPTCTPDAHTLCLNNGRFSVTANFQATPEGPSTPASAVPLTSDTGYFWFFDPTNVEVVTKALDGCSTNGQYWFFASGLTNVGVQINVTDTVTGASKPYSNAFGTAFQPIQDTTAFPCP